MEACQLSKKYLSTTKRLWFTHNVEKSYNEIAINSNTPFDEKVFIAQARVKPGVTTARYFLERIEEKYVIIS